MPARTLVVVNPRSRRGATGRRWPRFEGRLRAVLGDVEVEATRGPRDAERIAREAARAGVERLVVVGGDGTTSEVASGVLDAGLGDRTELAVLPFGTGADLPRSLGIPRDPEAALARIAEGAVRRVDAGRVRYRDRDGKDATTWFVNVASVGLGGLVDELVNRGTKRLGGRVAFLLATLRALAGWKSPHVRLTLDGEPLHDGKLVLAAAAGGRFFGGGMHIAPGATLDDGLLDVVVVPDMPKSRLVARLPHLYRGTHVDLPEVSVRRGARLGAEATDPAQTVWLELDGEVPGTLPVSIEVLPGALAFVGVEV